MEPGGGSGDKKPAEQQPPPTLDVAFLQAALRGARDAQAASTSSSASAPAAPTVVLPEAILPAAAKLILPVVPQTPPDEFEKAKSDIASWISANPAVQLVMTGLRKDEHIMDFTVGPSNAAFQVIFNENWRPLLVYTAVPELETYVTNANVFLDDRQAANNSMSVRELLSVFGQIVPLDTITPNSTDANAQVTDNIEPAPEEDDVDMDAPPVDPTPQEWDTVIIPGLRRYLQNENHPNYAIDEWIWRVKNHLKRGGGEVAALDMIMSDIFSGNPPRELYKYFRNRRRNFAFNPYYLQQKPEDRHYVTISGTPEGAARLRKEIEALKTLNCKELGFSATPSGRDLYHWTIKFFGFPLTTELGQDLANHHQIHPPPARRWRPPPSDEEQSPAEPEIKQTDICLEMKFLPDYPNSAPLFRVISPHLNFADGTVMAAAILHAVASAGEKESMQVDAGSPAPSPPAAASKPAAAPSSPFLAPGQSRNAKKKALSVSSHLEAHEEGWNPDTSVADLLTRIRSKLLSGARVDLSSEDVPLPTVGTYWRQYICHPLFAASPEDEYGGKVILPTSALEEITQFEDASPIFHMHDPASRLAQRAHATMIFEISALSGKRSFCGVLEFTGQEGTIQVPKWMMQNLGIEQGVMVQLRRVALPKGDFLQLQPESADFLLLPDPKAALEWVLPRFVALATNDSIVVSFQDQRHILHVLSVKPGRAISITDSDINLDFAPPRVGTVPAKTPAPAVVAPVKPAAKAPPAAGTATGALATTSDQVEGKDFKVCDNCRRKVPIAAHTMHSLTCARMNWYCLSEEMQILTERGFVFLDELLRIGPDLRVAAYNDATKTFKYEKPSAIIINPKATQCMIELTAAPEARRWGTDSDEYGRLAPMGARAATGRQPEADEGKMTQYSNAISQVVTREHDMFVRRGQLYGGQNARPRYCWKTGFGKLKASELHQLATANDAPIFKMLAHAAAGIEPSYAAMEPAYQAQLGITSEKEELAFLELVGYWLGDGSLDTRGSYVCFSPIKAADIEYLHTTLNSLGLAFNRSGPTDKKRQVHFDVEGPLYTFFFAEYGHKYKCYEVDDEVPAPASAPYDAVSSLAGSHLQPEKVKSTKWLPSWAWSLSKQKARALIAGVCRANGAERAHEKRIYTSSARFRDELVRLCLHAGYSAHFKLEYPAGTVRGIDAWGKDIVATTDAYSVLYSDNIRVAQPVLHGERGDIKEVQYTGRTWCVTVSTGLIIARRAFVTKDGTISKASRAQITGNCKDCDTAVPKDQRQAHMDEAHKLVTCECGAPMENRYLERHKTEDCSSRIVQCMYCEMKLPMAKRAEHEVKCGDLTESCQNCKQYIQKRSRLSHLLSCTKESAAAPRPFSFPKPPPRSRTPMDQDLFFCEKCGAPFPLFDDLQVHLFTVHYEEVVVPTAMEESLPPTPAAPSQAPPVPGEASASPAALPVESTAPSGPASSSAHPPASDQQSK